MARDGLAVRLLRPLPMVVALYAFVLCSALQVYVVVHHFGGADFQGTLWAPGHNIRHGLSPYPSAFGSMAGSPSVYLPPLIILIGVPFSLLPFAIGAVMFGVVLLACSAVALWLVGLRDWRCYATALLSVPVLGSAGYGNPTPLVLLTVAIAYRTRQAGRRSALAVAAAVIVKPFVIPLFAWLAPRRAAVGVTAFVVSVTGAWAAIDFDGLTRYPQLLSRLTTAQGSHGASVYALTLNLGAGRLIAVGCALAAAVVVLIAGRASFESAILASLLGPTIVWGGYYMLLFLVLAIRSPRYSWRWLIGLCYVPLMFNPGTTRPTWALLLAIAGAVFVTSPGFRRVSPAALPARSAPQVT
jgi:hypothetical protein